MFFLAYACFVRGLILLLGKDFFCLRTTLVCFLGAALTGYFGFATWSGFGLGLTTLGFGTAFFLGTALGAAFAGLLLLLAGIDLRFGASGGGALFLRSISDVGTFLPYSRNQEPREFWEDACWLFFLLTILPRLLRTRSALVRPPDVFARSPRHTCRRCWDDIIFSAC